ncbi:MAG: hypothetical protein MR210_00310 [Erysipelotrichaceae bacterium]|nr:hypothetical protein [Erysipelotrichaceae bacterium]MDY5252651.1 hypothetical protein [Erysipelotrichaceae bacterium]
MSITKSTLTLKRIIITIALFALIPILFPFLNQILDSKTITYTVLVNVIGCIVFIYDYDLLALHYNRVKKNAKESLIYFLVGLVFYSVLFFINEYFLHGYLPHVNPHYVKSYIFGAPFMYLAYTYTFAILTSICYKSLTDHLSIKDKEFVVILFSGLLFGLLYTVAFVPFSKDMWIASYILISIQVGYLSYSYNQTTSFLPGAIAMGTVLLAYNLMLLF